MKSEAFYPKVVSNSSKDSNKTVQLIIQADDQASKVVKTTGVNFKQLRERSIELSDGLTIATNSMKALVTSADFARARLTETAVVIGGLSSTILGVTVLAASKVTLLSQAVGQLKNAINSPVAQPFISIIREEAEEATKAIAPLSEILKGIRRNGSQVGKGFFNLDGNVLSNLESTVEKSTTKLRNSIFNSLEGSIGGLFASSGSSGVLGRIATRLDRELASTIIDGAFSLAIGQGPVQSLIKSIATNPAVTKFVPQFLQNLIGGSTTGAIDSLVAQLSNARSALGLQGIVADLSTVIPASGFKDVAQGFDKYLADAVVDGAFSKYLGQGAPQDLAKGIVKSGVVNGLLPGFIQELGKGSLSNAVKSFVDTIFVSKFTEGFNFLNDLGEGVGKSQGTRIGNELIFGLDESLKQRIKRTEQILGSSLNGIGTKLLGLGDLDKAFMGLNLAGYIEGKIVRGLVPVVESASAQLTLAASNAIADGVGSFFPGYMRNIVAATLKETGASKLILDSLVKNLTSDNIKGFVSEFGKLEFIEAPINAIKVGLEFIYELLDGAGNVATSLVNGLVAPLNLIKSGLEGSYNLLDGLGGVATALMAGMAQPLSFIQSGLEGIYNLLDGAGDIGEAIANSITPLTDTLTAAASKSSEFLETFRGGNQLINGFVDVLQAGIGGVSSSLAGLPANLSGSVNSALGSLKSGVGNALIDVSGLITSLLRPDENNLAKNFGQAIGNAVGGVKSFLGDRLVDVNNLITDILRPDDRNLAQNIGASVTKALSGVKSLVGDSLININNLLLPGGFVDDLRKKIAPGVEAVKGFVDQVQSLSGQAIERIRQLGNGLLGGLIDRIGDGLEAFNQNVAPTLEAAFKRVDDFFGGVFTTAIGQLGRNAGRAFAGSFFGAYFDAVAPGLDKIDSLILKSINNLSSLSKRIAEPIGALSNIPGAIAGFTEPLKIFNIAQEAAGALANNIAAVTEKITFFSQGMQALQQFVATGPFKLLIGQTVELREQLLATQSSLVATSKIFQNGIEIKDPTAAIQALNEPINKSISELRKESLELVGITSKELVPLYQVVAGKITSVSGSLSDAKNLTLDIAASLGTLNIPLHQSQQEISAIFNSAIDVNSALGKALGITNEQVNQWKQQGRFIEELRSRLVAFRAGNALAANTLNGVAGNISEIFDEIGRRAGEKLLDPLLKELNGVYQYLTVNQEALITGFSEITGYLLQAGLALADTLKSVFKAVQPTLAEVPAYLFKSLANAMVAFSNGVTTTVKVLEPVLNIIGELAKSAAALSGPFLQAFLLLKSLEIGVSGVGKAFGILSQVLPGAGELMFLVDQRSQGLVNQFITMSGVVKEGAAGFLLLGQNIANIPGAMGVLTQALGPLGSVIAPFVPQMAGMGIQLVGLIKLFPIVGLILGNLVALTPALFTAAAAFIRVQGAAGSPLFAALSPLSGLFTGIASSITPYTNATDRAANVNRLFKDVLIQVGREAAKQLIIWGTLAAGAYLAFRAIDQFVLKNQQLLDFLSSSLKGISAFGEGISQFLTNPIVQTTLAVVGLGAAIIAINSSLLVVNPVVVAIASAVGLAISTFSGWDKSIGLLIASLAGLTIAVSVARVEVMKFIATQLASSLMNSVSALRALSGILRLIGLGSLGKEALTAAAGLKFVSASAAAGTLTFSGFTAAIGSAALALAGLVAPIAIAIAGVVAIGSVAQNGVLGFKGISDYAREEAEEFARVGDGIADAGLELAQKISNTQKKQEERTKNGIALSQEEYKENAQLMSQAKQRQALMQDEIAALKQAQSEAKSDESKTIIQGSIDRLEKVKSTLNALSTKVNIAPKDLPVLGTVFQQLASKAKVAEEAINKSSGDPEIFKQKAKEIVDITQQQLKLGQISGEEAQRRLSLIATNVNADQQLQLEAQEAITQSYQTESQKQVEAKQSAIAQIEADIASGDITEIEGAKKVTESKKQELETQLQAAEEVHKRKLAIIDEEISKATDALKVQLAAVDAKLAKLPAGDSDDRKKLTAEAQVIQDQIAAINQSGNNTKTEADRQYVNTKTKLNAQLEQNATEGVKRVNESELRSLERSQKIVLDTVKSAENERLIAVQESVNKGTISKSQADEERAQSSVRNAQQEIAAEKNKQAELETLLAGTTIPKLRKDLEDQIRASRLRTQDLVKSSLDSESKAYEAHIATQKADLERNQNQQLTNLQKLLNIGKVQQEEIDLAKADSTVKRLTEELKLETKDKDKQAQLSLQLQEAIFAQVNARINKTKALLERVQIEEQIAIEKGVNAGTRSKESAEVVRGQQTVKRLNQEISLETRNTTKRLQLQFELEKALGSLYESTVAQKLSILEQGQLKEQILLQKGVNSGVIGHKDAEVEKAKQSIDRIQEQFDLEKRDKTKKLQLELQLNQAIETLDNARIAQKLDLVERSQLKEQILLQQGINAGVVAHADAEVKKAQLSFVRAQEQFNLEKRDQTKKLQLQLEVEKASAALYEATVAQKLAALERLQLKEQIILQKGINAGLVRHEDAEVKKAELSVERLREQFELEKRDQNKKLQLELQLNQAIESLYNARIARAKARLEDQNLAYRNQIDAQNELIERQSQLYELIGKGIENRNKLLQAGKDLAQAASNFMSTEIDLMAQGERSELKKKELARINAAIKLEALKTQQQYERESLNMQIEQNKLALERERIQNRMAQGQQQAAIADAQGNLEIANLDKKTTPAQRRALELKVQSAMRQLEFLKKDGELIDAKGNADDRVAEMNKRKQQFEQLGQTRQAQAALIETLAPGQKARSNRVFKEMLANDLGAGSYKEFLSGGRNRTNDTVQANFGTGRRGNLLSNFDPGLEDLSEVLPRDRLNRAMQDASNRFDDQFGPARPGETTYQAPGGPSLKLLPEITAGMKLPDLKDVGINLAKSGNIFSQGIDKLVGIFKSGKANGTTYQININNEGVKQQSSGAIAGNNNQVSIEKVVKAVKWMAAT